MGWLWPRLSDRAAAERVSQGAVKWYVVAAILSGALGLISLFSGAPLTRSPTDSRIAASSLSLVDAALFGWIAVKVRSMSLGWSVTGLVLGAAAILINVAAGDLSPVGLLVELFVLLKLFHAVRAALAWRSFEQPVSTAPIEPQ